MQENRTIRARDFFVVWSPLVITIVIQMAVSFFIMEFTYIAVLLNHETGGWKAFIEEFYNVASSVEVNSILSVVYSSVSILVFGIWYFRTFGKKEILKNPFGKITGNWGKFILGIFILSIGMQYLCVYITSAVAVVRPDLYVEYQQLLETSGFTGDITVGLLIYAIILGPISEEFIFRGLTFGYARRVLPVFAANIAQAAIFAVFHQNALQGIYTFIVGLVFGYIAYKYENIVVSIVVHILFNIFGTIGALLVPETGSVWSYYLILMVSVALMYIGIRLLMKAMPSVKNSDGTSDM